MGVSVRTVHIRRAPLMRKLGATSKVELVRKATELGIILDWPSGEPAGTIDQHLPDKACVPEFPDAKKPPNFDPISP